MARSQQAPLVLNCLVFGGDVDRLFYVEVTNTTKVIDLKEAIRKKKDPELNHVPPDALTLWKVDMDMDKEGFEDDFRRLRLGNRVHGVQKLSPRTPLGKAFTDVPNDGHLHIVVQNDLEINCFVQGDDPRNAFPVKIGSHESVGTLKQTIRKEKEHAFEGVDADTLVLWKVSILADVNLGQNLGNLDPASAQPLESLQPLSEVFSQAPAPKHVHVVVLPPNYARKRGPEDFSPDEPSLKIQRTNYYKQFPSAAPSTVAQPAEFAKQVQAHENIQMFSNRPRSITSTPITLLHPVFGEFDDDTKNSQADPKISSFVLELATMMCEFHPDEGARTLAFRQLIWKHFEIKLEAAKVAGTGFTTDGHASHGFYVYISTEGKNEIGSTLADPAIQSAVYYHHHIREFAASDSGSRFPCLHIYYFGPYLGFAGSVFSDHIHYEPLSPVIPFDFSPHDTGLFAMATCFFRAFKNASAKLKDYYTKLSNDSVLTQLSREEARFPYPTTFTHLTSSTETRFKLTAQPMPGKLVFLGSTTPGGDERLLIKFARTYALDLHKYCADMGHAPPLLGCETLAGGWTMVVMEYLDNHPPFSTFKDPSSISAQLRQMLDTLVTSFHGKNFVHGDLRASNLLVRKDDTGVSMKLVDFDWGGKEGTVRYPLGINRVGINRPNEVIDGAVITAEHDRQMVAEMFRGLS